MKASAKPKVFISYVWLDEKDKNGDPVLLKTGKVARIPSKLKSQNIRHHTTLLGH